MKSTNAAPPYETSEIGTPKDYTHDLYQVYFEVGEHQGKAKKILEDYLGEERKGTIQTLTHGYIVEMALQCTPDVVKRLTDENIAIYQVNRFAKLDGRW
jgi:hypothetical protein